VLALVRERFLELGEREREGDAVEVDGWHSQPVRRDSDRRRSIGESQAT
jgi:hypothetical protein